MDKVFNNSKGQVIGHLKNGNYSKSVVSTKHLMKMFNGYGIDKHIVDQLKDLGCKKITIEEKDTGIVYTCSFEMFLEHCITKNFDGMQCFIPKRYLSEDNPSQPPLINI